MKTALIAIIAVFVVALSLNVAGDDAYKNCGICKPMMAEEGLMQNMKWESHEIATGLVGVTMVHPDHQKAFERAHGKMMDAVKRLEGGEKMELCPFCTSMSNLAKAGAHIENLDSNGPYLMTITSESADVIAKIHAHKRWSDEEMKKHSGAQEHTGHDHDGHSHGG